MDRVRANAKQPLDGELIPPRSPAMSRPPLLQGEERAIYERLFAEICRLVQPADIFEEMWVQDITDAYWETSRLARLKVAYLTSRQHVGLNKLLEPMEVEWNLPAWAAGDKKARDTVDKILKKAELTTDSVVAATWTAELDSLEKIDRAIARAEARRNAAIRELERHRFTQSQTNREKVRQIEQTDTDNDNTDERAPDTRAA